MTNEMVDRVARALCYQYEIDDGFSPEQATRASLSDMHRNFREAAKMAIDAMRQPTAEMCEASLRQDFAEADKFGSYWGLRNDFSCWGDHRGNPG